MEESGLDVVERPHGVWVVTFNRPEVRNAINARVVGALGRAVARLEAAPGLRGVVLTGAGGAFVSGGDLKELSAGHDRESGARYCGEMTAHLARLSALPVPVVAAVEGVALGGGMEIALACDLRFAGEGARLGFRQIRMGLTPGWGGARRLVELVGRAAAMRLLWEGRDLATSEALAMGLVDRVVPAGQAFAAALVWMEDLSTRAPLAVAGVKRVVTGLGSRPPAEASAFELESFLDLWETEDHTEAVRAFFEGRDPRWTGR